MGVVGYILKKFGFEMAPLILGLVLGPFVEKSFRQTLFMARGDVWFIINRPLTTVFFLIAFTVIIFPKVMRLIRWINNCHKPQSTS